MADLVIVNKFSSAILWGMTKMLALKEYTTIKKGEILAERLTAIYFRP